MKTFRTVIVIPPRNRADLAWKSVNFVLAQSDEGLVVLCFRQSTAIEERPELPRPCQENEGSAGVEFSVGAIEFDEPESALQYALNHERPRSTASTHQSLLQGVPLAFHGEQLKADTIQI